MNKVPLKKIWKGEIQSLRYYWKGIIDAR